MCDEEQIRLRMETWAKAARERNWEGLLAWHHKDIVLFEVTPPLQSIGIESYRKSWAVFLDSLDCFQIRGLHIVAGADVAFCFAPMTCIYQGEELDFRLTVGFKKISGQWWFMHEHHSVPAG